MQQMKQTPGDDRQKVGRWFWPVLLAVGIPSLLWMLNWVIGVPASTVPFIRVEPIVVGAALNIVAALVLLLLIPFALVRGPRRMRWWLIVVLIPLGAWGALLGLVASADFATVLQEGHSGALEPIERVELTTGRATLYRTNGGATTAFGILLRREQSIAPFVLKVTNVRNWYPASSGTIERAGLDSVRVNVTGTPEVFDLRGR